MVLARQLLLWSIWPQVAGCSNFVNADLIAAGLSPLAPERELITASRLLLKESETHISAQEDFAFETTLSGRGYLRLMRRLQKEGWRVELYSTLHCQV